MVDCNKGFGRFQASWTSSRVWGMGEVRFRTFSKNTRVETLLKSLGALSFPWSSMHASSKAVFYLWWSKLIVGSQTRLLSYSQTWIKKILQFLAQTNPFLYNHSLLAPANNRAQIAIGFADPWDFKGFLGGKTRLNSLRHETKCPKSTFGTMSQAFRNKVIERYHKEEIFLY